MISRLTIPEHSILKSQELHYDYIDSYSETVFSNARLMTPYDLLHLFLSAGPKWADTLMTIRDKIVGLFGLKTSKKRSDEQLSPENREYQMGEQIGIFKFLEKTENEIVLGEEDKHLNFKVSLLLEPVLDNPSTFRISITTVVKFNNCFGKIYFLPVKPVHKLIIKSLLNNMLRQVEKIK